MGLFDFFKKKKAAKSHIKSLLALSAADGDIDPKELVLITAVAAREGLSSSEFKALLDGNSNFQYTIPSSDEQKLRYLRDMVSIMMTDGEIHDNEMALCKLAALRMGYRPEVIEALLIDIIEDIIKKI